MMSTTERTDDTVGRGRNVISGIVALGVIFGAACSDSGTGSATPTSASARPGAETAAPPPARIGTVLELGNWRYAVRAVDVTPSIDVSTSQTAKEILKPKGTYVVVLLQLTNIGSRSASIGDADFQLRDSRAVAYDPAASDERKLVSFRAQTQLGEQIAPGVMVTTTLLFDVPPGTTGMSLTLRSLGTPGTILLY
jgi:hypothetical protein